MKSVIEMTDLVEEVCGRCMGEGRLQLVEVRNPDQVNYVRWELMASNQAFPNGNDPIFIGEPKIIDHQKIKCWHCHGRGFTRTRIPV